MAIKAMYGEMSNEKWTLKTWTGDRIFRLGNDMAFMQYVRNIEGSHCSLATQLGYTEFSEKS